MPMRSSSSGSIRKSCIGTLALLCALTSAPPCLAANCDSTSKGFTPLVDLGLGTYKGQSGGLYPGGSNSPPAAHTAAGLSEAEAIAPLDTLGQPDSTGGAIVMISVGMSNTSQEFSTFIPIANAYAPKNPRVRIVNGAQGGRTARVFADPNAEAWGVIDSRLRAQGLAPLQVQVVWLKQANAGPTQAFPAHAESLLNDLRKVVRNIRARYPNARLCYFSSRIYAGYADTPLNPEPYAYESAFSVRWLIEEQLDGSPLLNFDPGAGPVEAPWLAWGPYLWADGLVPRSDGLVWQCSDLASDGTHPSGSGSTKVANLLLDFLANDPTATPWFLRGTASVEPLPPGRVVGLHVPRPNPFHEVVSFAIDLAEARRLRLDVIAPSGRRVRSLFDSELSAGRWSFEWNGTDRFGARVEAGVYFLIVRVEGEKPLSKRVTLVR